MQNGPHPNCIGDQPSCIGDQPPPSTPPAVEPAPWPPVAPLAVDGHVVSSKTDDPATLDALAGFIREHDATANTANPEWLLRVIPTAAGTPFQPVDRLKHNGLYIFQHDRAMAHITVSRLRATVAGLPGAVLAARQPGADAGVWSLIAGPPARDEAQHRTHWLAIFERIPPAVRGHTSPVCPGIADPVSIGHDADVWLADSMPEPHPGAGSLEVEAQTLEVETQPPVPDPPPSMAVVMDGISGSLYPDGTSRPRKGEILVTDLVGWDDLVNLICNGRDEAHREQTRQARAAKPQSDLAKLKLSSIDRKADPDAYKAARKDAEPHRALYDGFKKGLPTGIPAASNPPGSKTAAMDPTDAPSSLYNFDVDEGRETMDKAEVRAELLKVPGIAMIGESVGADALWCSVRGPVLESSGDLKLDLDEWKRQWHFIRESMPDMARISTAQGSNNFNRNRFLPHDPTFWAKWPDVAHPAAPAGWEPPKEGGDAPAAAPEPPKTRAGSRGAYAPATDLRDLDLVQDALAFIPCPKKGEGVGRKHWLNLIGDLNTLDVPEPVIAAWCASGSGTTCGDLEEVSKSIRSQRKVRVRLESLNSILGIAHKKGWRRPDGRGCGPVTVINQGEGADRIPVWHRIGDHLVRTRLSGLLVFCGVSAGVEEWWGYDDPIWSVRSAGDHQVTDAVGRRRYAIAQELRDQGDKKAAKGLSGSSWDRQASLVRGDMWASLRSKLKGPAPTSELHLLGTPDCIVDLRDSSRIPHAPQHGIRAITVGRFIPEEAVDMKLLLLEHFQHVFTPETVCEYVRIVALALSGRAQNYRALALFHGGDRSGKGSSVNLVLEAVGRLGIQVDADWLGQTRCSDIDATATACIEQQVRVIAIDEIGAEGSKIRPKKLLTITGNGRWSARKPHGPLLQARVPAMLMVATVDIPDNLDRHSGIEERLAVLSTTGELKVLPGDRAPDEETFTQDLLDALITLAVLQVPEVYEPGYGKIAPTGGDQTKREAVLREMDRVAAWIADLTDEDVGQTVDSLAERYCSEGGENISGVTLGRKINRSTVWQTIRRKVGAVQAARLYRR